MDHTTAELKTIETEVFEAMGEISMCWEPIPSGVFQSTNAKRIGDELMAKIEKDVPNAIRILCKALKEDKVLYIAYQANIAMAFKDEVNRLRPVTNNWNRDLLHTIANQAADNFLQLLIK